MGGWRPARPSLVCAEDHSLSSKFQVQSSKIFELVTQNLELGTLTMVVNCQSCAKALSSHMRRNDETNHTSFHGAGCSSGWHGQGSRRTVSGGGAAFLRGGCHSRTAAQC